MNRIVPLLLLVLLSAASAFAQDWGRVMTPDRPLNVRYGRSLNTDRVTTIMPGERVRVDFIDGEWCAVFPLDEVVRKESRAIGFVKVKYLVVAGDNPEQTWGKLVAPKGMLNIRAKRDRHSEHKVTLQAGQVVKIDFEKGGWVAVFDPGESLREEKLAMGYARAKYLFPATAKQKGNAVAAAAPEERPEPVPVKVSPESMAKAPTEPGRTQEPANGVTASGSASAGQGSSVTVKVGAETAPETESGQPWGRVVTLKRRANVRSGRTAGSHLVSTLKPGDSVRVDFLEKGWYAVFPVQEKQRSLNKAMGYVYASLLGEPAVELQPRTLRLEPKTEAPLPIEPEPVAQVPDPIPEPMPEAAAESMPAAGEPVAVTPEPMDSRPEPVETDPDGEVVHAKGRDQLTITPRDQGDEPHKGPIPLADKVRHGFRYGIIQRTPGTNAAEGRILIKVYMELTVIPADDSLRDFARTLYREEIGEYEEMLLLFYLPGQDTKDLAYGQAKFDTSGLIEFWTRRSTLYGTRFLP